MKTIALNELNNKSIDELTYLYKNGYKLEGMQEPQIKSLQLDIPIMGVTFMAGLVIGSLIFALYKRKKE